MYGYYSRTVCNQERVSLVCILHNNIKFWNITCKLVILEMVVIFFQHSFLLFLNNFCPLWYFWTILVDPMAPHRVTKHLQPLYRSIIFRKFLLTTISLDNLNVTFQDGDNFWKAFAEAHTCAYWAYQEWQTHKWCHTACIGF